MNNIKSSEDGITHVNIYSKGRTSLGRMLSNFYRFPIQTDDGCFFSVEAYWYFLSIDENVSERESLRGTYGFAAKKLGIDILKRTNNGKRSRTDPDFENKILRAIRYKFERHLSLLTLELSDLPLEHYYDYNGNIVYVTDKYQWMIDGIYEMRDEFRSKIFKPYQLCEVIGDCCNYNTVDCTECRRL